MSEASRPISFPTPKKVFLETEANIQAHRRMVDSQTFRSAAATALSHYHMMMLGTQGVEISDPNYQQDSHVRFMKMRGAYEFMEVFFSLSEVPAPMAAKRENIESLS